MNDLSTRTLDELLAASAALDDRSRGVLGRLESVTATAHGRDGIAVTVNLEGMLVALDLGAATRTMSATALAQELQSLVQRASVTAMTEGVAVLAPFAGEDLTAELTSLTALPGPAPAPARRPRAAQADEDFSRQTWQLLD